MIEAPTDAAIDRAARALLAGGLVAIPTETVYGLAADASRRDAVERVYAVKGRPAGHPLIVHVPDAATARRWARLDARASDAALARFVALGGAGLAAPSANRFGRVSPTRAAHVADDLGDDVPTVLDGGASDVGVESTIVDLTRARPALLRPGRIGRDALEAVLRSAFARQTPPF
nr:L-threonylcarbamoyladenylate synthase [Burkholderiaceae bacterium]